MAGSGASYVHQGIYVDYSRSFFSRQSTLSPDGFHTNYFKAINGSFRQAQPTFSLTLWQSLYPFHFHAWYESASVLSNGVGRGKTYSFKPKGRSWLLVLSRAKSLQQPKYCLQLKGRPQYKCRPHRANRLRSERRSQHKSLTRTVDRLQRRDRPLLRGRAKPMGHPRLKSR